MKPFISRGTARLLSVFAVIVILLSLTFFYVDRIAVFFINQYTGYNLSYKEWSRPSLNTAELGEVYLELEDPGLAIRAEKASLTLEGRRSFAEKKLILACEMRGLSFVSSDPAGEDKSTDVNILEVPFHADQKYESIQFVVYLGDKTVKVEGMKALSRDVNMTGEYAYDANDGSVAIKLKISFSPELAASFADNVRENVLAPDEDGWYSTVIDYKGPAVLLKALYSIA